MGFTNAAEVMQSQRRAEARNDKKGDPPAEQAGKDAAEQRRKSWCRRSGNHGERQSPAKRLAVEQVTRDGA
nr:hypothetical protein [Sinorhizobium fredii]